MRLYRLLTVTTPPGTAKAAPQQTVWTLQDAALLKLEVTIPAGHSGLTGVAVKAQGSQIFPWNLDGFFVGDNRELAVELGYEVTTSGLIVFTYNTGAYQHSHYLRATIETFDPRVNAPGGPSTLALALAPGGGD